MRCPVEDQLNDFITICGHHIFPAYLIQGHESNLMIEAGVNILGPRYKKDIEMVIGEKEELDYLFVTHLHYDHMGALPYLKRMIPNVQLGASEKAAQTIKKESVVKTLNFLSDQLQGYFGDLSEKGNSDDVSIDSVNFECILKEGDRYNIGGITCEIYETPGHTRDHLSFYLPEPEILFPGEAFGNPIREDENAVKVEFLSSYTDYIESMEKLMVLKPRTVAMSHLYFYEGYDNVQSLFDRSYKATLDYRELIESHLDAVHGDIDAAVDRMVRIEYDEKGNIYQERNAYIANIRAQIKAIAELKT